VSTEKRTFLCLEFRETDKNVLKFTLKKFGSEISLFAPEGPELGYY